jgi:uncharacterized membrane protein
VELFLTPWSPRLTRRLTRVARSLWFLPAVMASAGVLLGLVMPVVDAIPDVLQTLRFGWLRALVDSAPAGAQQLLGTSAGALATILGVAFSLTLVTLQLAAAQYTPRLVGNLLEDPVTKLVLGSYLGTVAYLLLVLRAVHGGAEDEASFVPRLSIFVGLLLILGCLGLLAYFVHHLGESIQIASVGARVTDRTIRNLEGMGRTRGRAVSKAEARGPGTPARLPCDGRGYVQVVELERLAEVLPEGAIARVEVAAGDHVIAGAPLLSLWLRRALTERQLRDVQQAFAIGAQRSIDQDVLFGVRQLADVALRALSRGVNDETTAVMMVNDLGAVLAAACEHLRDGGPWRRLELGRVVIFAPSLEVRRVVEDGFAGIVRFAADHPRVLARVAEVLAEAGDRDPDADARDALVEAASWIEHAASTGGLAEHELALVMLRVARLRAPRDHGAGRPHAIH